MWYVRGKVPSRTDWLVWWLLFKFGLGMVETKNSVGLWRDSTPHSPKPQQRLTLQLLHVDICRVCGDEERAPTCEKNPTLNKGIVC